MVRLSVWGMPAPVPPPAPLTSLIGRDGPSQAVRDLVLDPGVRLVTLVGPGGIGKTRLALAVADDLIGHFDAVAWAPLESLREAGAVLPAVARALGAPERGRASPLDGAALAIRGVRVLLLVDNVEHLLEASADLAALLNACPTLTMLATSRTVLRIRGERVLAVPPLDVASEEDAVDGGAAVQLFAERAASVAPDFRLTSENLGLATEICRLLDGLPLAIELAASRVNHLHPAALHARLGDGLGLLTGGARDLPARQQALRDAIAWSYDLLTPEQQALFRRLAVFVDGFTLEAAEAVQEERTKKRVAPSVLDALAALVDANLIQFTGSRYRLLATIRAFAAEALAGSGDLASVEPAHAAYYLTLAEELDLGPSLPFEERHRAAIEAERGNLMAALEWLANSDDDGFLRLVAVLGWFWWIRGEWQTGRPWLELAWNRLAQRDSAGEAPVAIALSLGAITAAGHDNFERMEEILTTELHRRRRLGDAYGTASILCVLGWCKDRLGQPEAAIALLEEGLGLTATVAQRPEAPLLEASMFTHLCIATRSRGQLERARDYAEEALRLQREAGHTYGVTHNLISLGLIARDLGEADTATRRFREALQGAQAIGQPRIVVRALQGLVGIDAEVHPARAVRLLAGAQRLRELIGMTESSRDEDAARDRVIATCRELLGETAFSAAWAAGHDRAPEATVAEALADPGGGVDPDTAPVSLTARETDVLRLLVSGLGDRQIAEILFVGVRTVETHVARIFAKLGVRTRADATAVAVATGLVDSAAPQTASDSTPL